jgi:murein DD-endopeptidase MepM/ murein hydrolase activator NlpD
MRFKQLRNLICAGMLGSSILFCGVSEAGVVTDRLPLQCYADHQVNTYNSPGAAKRAGYISANVDLIKITQVRGDGWCYGSYPGAGGKRVSRWFRITDVCADAGYTNRSANVRGKQTVYRTRSGGATLGSVSNNEGVIVVADNGSRAQIVYRLDNGTGYKLGWVPSSAVARVATPTPAPVVSPVVRPQTDTYVSPAEGDYYLLPEADSGYALDVAGGGDAPEQTILQLYHKNNTDAQIFHIKRISGEWHIIQHKRTGRVANCQWGGNSNGTRLWLYHYDGTASCHWRFIKQNNDSYLIQSQLSGNPIMELQNNNVYAQGRIQLWNRHSGQAGRWKLVRVQAVPPQPVVQEQAGYIKTSGANLYFRQSPNGTILGKLSNNTPVTVLQHPATNGWSKIRYNGTTGYVASQYVTIGNPPIPNISVTKESTELRYPLNNIYVCGNDWMTKYSKRPSRPYHAGIDVKSSSGDKTVYAVADGTVAAVGWNNSNGNFVIVQHMISGRKIYSFSCHMSKLLVSKGIRVKCGTPIGIVGNTGSASNGEHLHFTFVDKIMNSGGYWGYVTSKGEAVSYQGYTFYSPKYVIDNKRLP